jgi:hypothetical protein
MLAAVDPRLAITLAAGPAREPRGRTGATGATGETGATGARGAPGRDVRESRLWKTLLSMLGVAGCALLLLRPSLRDTAAWLVCGGAAGIFPLDRLLDRFGVK